MHDNGWLDDEALTLATTEKIRLQRFTGGFEAPHAVALVAADAVAKIDSREVRTTILSTLQTDVESIIARRLALLRDRHVTQAAAVVIENRSGHVLALAGSRDFFDNEGGGQINGAWTPHSAGSAVKPFTYMLALQRGFTPATIIEDLPIEFSTNSGIYRPENYDHRNYGPVTLRTALGSSLNIPAVRVLKQIGGEKILYDTMQSVGISTFDQPPEHYGLGLTIGNAPVRLLELANAYACLARLGEFKPWTLIANDAGSATTDMFPKNVCYLIADILSDNQARVPTFGPHSVIRLPFKCAVKTGTSRNYRDNWTMGFTPEFTVGVWAGNFDNTPMEGVSGVTGAGPIFRDIFLQLNKSFGTTWFDEPAGIVHAKIDPRNGKTVGALTTRSSREDIFLSGTVPPTITAQDYESDTGKAYIPHDYAKWLAQGDQWLSGLVCVREAQSDDRPPRIVTPTENSVIFLDPDLRDGGRRLMLGAQGGGDLRWSSPTLRIEPDGSRFIAWLTPGRHEICVTDDATGLHSSVSIDVRAPDGRSHRGLANGQTPR